MARLSPLSIHLVNATPQRDEIGRLTWREALAVAALGNLAMWGVALGVGWWMS